MSTGRNIEKRVKSDGTIGKRRAIFQICIAKDIIEAECLKDYNLGLEHKVKAGEIIIAREDGKWRVSIANDRAEIVSTSISEFDSEDEAADDFLTRLRGLNRIKAARQKTFGRNDSMV